MAAAREGDVLQPATARGWAQLLLAMNADVARRPYLTALNTWFAPAGRASAPGARQHNAALANTFELIASEGRAGFYRGELAPRLATAVCEAGGALPVQDLADAPAQWASPLATPYRGHEVHALPPHGRGACRLQMLNFCAPARRPGSAVTRRGGIGASPRKSAPSPIAHGITPTPISPGSR